MLCQWNSEDNYSMVLKVQSKQKQADKKPKSDCEIVPRCGGHFANWNFGDKKDNGIFIRNVVFED